MSDIQLPNMHAGKAVIKAQADCIEELRTTIAALQAEVERLREALKPLANMAGHFDGFPPPKFFGDTDFATRYSSDERVSVKLGYLRAARAALGGSDA